VTEPLRLLVVDDEPLARMRLRALLDALPEAGAVIVGEAGDAEAALAQLQAQPADAVLLDIGLPGRDGLRLAAALQALPRPPAVVFVTAHAGHALRAFELEAVDYLTKPVRRERLLAALQRLRQRQRPPAVPPASPEGPALVVHDRGRVLRLPHAEVLVLKAEQKYVTLRTAEHAYVLDESLTDLEQRLGAAFVRIHRNALVARRAIRELQLRGSDADGWAVRVAPLDEWLAVSRRQLATVRAALAGGGAAP
jgi:two-component system response regulator AlgR